MGIIATVVSIVVAGFKVDPKRVARVAHLCTVAIGYMYVATQVLEAAIGVLKQVLVGLGPQ